MQNLRLVAAAAYFLSPCSAVAQAFSAGTGFFIAPDGYIATCYHVIAGSGEIKVRDSTGQIYTASLVLTDIANDLAVIKADVKGSPVLPVRRSSDVRKGDTVFTVGYPNIDIQGMDAKVTEGIISSTAGIAGEPNSFQISVAVQPGNSGGALFDSRGAVIGIVSSKLAHMNALKRSGSLPENVNYAVKSNYLFELVATAPRLSGKVIGVTQKAAPEKLASIVARVEQATVLVIAKQGEQRTSPSGPPTTALPRNQEQPRPGLAPGSACTLSDQCSGDDYCIGSPRRCQPRFVEGHECNIHTDCVGSLTCTAGRCLSPAGPSTVALPKNQEQPQPSLATRRANRISSPDPIFPQDAIRAGITKGRVVAHLYITPQGTVSKVQIVESTPPGTFDASVTSALTYWTFDATGETYTTEVQINFTLKL